MTNDITPNPVGRPSVIDADTVQKLVDVFRLGVTDTAACSYAGIARTTFYAWLKNDPEFSNKIEAAKHYAVIAARQVVISSIIKDKDLNTSKWYLEKYDAKSDAPQVNTQVNIFNQLKEKYTVEKSTEGEVVSETNEST